MRIDKDGFMKPQQITGGMVFRVRQWLGQCWYVKDYGHDKDFESWKRIKIGGEPQYSYRCQCSSCQQDFDCCGQAVCSHVQSYLWGFITIGSYYVNV
jgi:hypothetical protein